jgi:hypothetical protein
MPDPRLKKSSDIPDALSLDALFVLFVAKAQKTAEDQIEKISLPSSRDGVPSPYGAKRELTQYLRYRIDLLWRLFGADLFDSNELSQRTEFLDRARTNVFHRYEHVEGVIDAIFTIDGEFESLNETLLVPIMA